MLSGSKPLILATAVLLTSQLQGCAAVLVGGTVGAATVAEDNRTLGNQIDDATIKQKIASAFRREDGFKDAHLRVNVYNGVALLTGQAPTEGLKEQAKKIASTFPNLKKVHNQVRVANPTAASVRAYDVWLASKVRALLLADERINSLKMDVIVEDSEVFLMGIVSQQQADIAIDVARNIDGVIKVINAFEVI